MVFFEGGEHASAAEGVAVFVDETACTACVFEGVALVVHEQLGLADSGVGMLFHLVDDGFNPVGGYFHIVVKKHKVFGIDLGKSLVVAIGEAIVLVEFNNTEGGVLLAQEREGVVGRAVVGNDNLGIAHSVGCY